MEANLFTPISEDGICLSANVLQLAWLGEEAPVGLYRGLGMLANLLPMIADSLTTKTCLKKSPNPDCSAFATSAPLPLPWRVGALQQLGGA